MDQSLQSSPLDLTFAGSRLCRIESMLNDLHFCVCYGQFPAYPSGASEQESLKQPPGLELGLVAAPSTAEGKCQLNRNRRLRAKCSRNRLWAALQDHKVLIANDKFDNKFGELVPKRFEKLDAKESVPEKLEQLDADELMPEKLDKSVAKELVPEQLEKFDAQEFVPDMLERLDANEFVPEKLDKSVAKELVSDGEVRCEGACAR